MCITYMVHSGEYIDIVDIVTNTGNIRHTVKEEIQKEEMSVTGR